MSRHTRNTDPFTSWAAGFEQEGRAQGTKVVILSALRVFGPLTHEDLYDAVNRVRRVSPSGVRTRTRELVDEGLVERVPDMVSKSRMGRASLLWRTVPPHG